MFRARSLVADGGGTVGMVHASESTLPDAIRVDAAFGRPMAEALFGAEFWTALKPYLGDETVPTEWILNHAPGVYEHARDSSNFPGTVNLGLLSVVLARARLRVHGADP